MIRGSHTTADGEALVAKLNSAGTALSYLTYLGGNQYDSGEAIAVDGAGNAYLAGDSLSSNLATPGATQTSYSGSQTAAFAARLASSARINQYSYDGLQRLVGALESPGASYAYGYDAAGNRTSLTVNGTIITTTYNLANQVTNAGYMYDAADNLTADGTATYTYDALSRMTARGSTTYSYNGDGVLVNLYYRAAPYAIMPMTTASFARYSASYIS